MNCPHCDTHIDEHEASPCFNAWVAEVVMELKGVGQDSVGDWQHLFGLISNRFVLEYSTDISAAWEVVVRLTTMGWMVFIAERLKCDNYCRLEWEDSFDPKWASIMVRNASIPLAICRAAIKASQ